MKAAAAGLAASAALVYAGTAMSAINPKLTVTSNHQLAGMNVTISAGSLNLSDDVIGKLQIFVPSGFTFKAPPTTVGTAVITAIETGRDPGTSLALTGGIGAVSPTDARVPQGSASCDNGAHLATWLVVVTGSEDSFSYPIFVDQTAGTETQYGSYKLVACFLAPAQAELGNRFLTMAIKVSGFTVPTKVGNYVWRSLWTPYTTNATTLNAAGSVEAQSTESIAAKTLSISGKQVRINGKLRNRVTLTGTLMVDGKPAANIIVAIHHGLKSTKLVSLGSTKTNAAGHFTKTVTFAPGAYFQAGATVASTTAVCQPSFGVPCVSATAGSTRLASNLIHFKS